MDNFEIPKSTPIQLLVDIPSLDLDGAMIPSGTLGTIEDFEINPHTTEIIGYYAKIYWMYEEYLYLDLFEFEVVDQVDRWENSLDRFDFELDDIDSE